MITISISVNCKYVELMIFFNIQHWRDMTCADYSEYSLLLSKFWIQNYNFHAFSIFLNVFLVPVAWKWTAKNSQTILSMLYYMTACFKLNSSEKNIQMFKVLPDFLFFPIQNEMQKWEYHHYAQVAFDFGQVGIVWWLSYCQVKEKLSVEPCNGLAPAQRQGITWTNATKLSIESLRKKTFVKFESKYKTFHSWQCVSFCRLRSGSHFV